MESNQLSLDLVTPLSEVPFVVVDVETTGMDPVTNRITELAMMKVRNGTLVGEFSTLVNPLQTIPASIVRMTGIDNVTVSNAPTAREVVPCLVEFLGKSVFVAHNVAFDWSFVYHTALRERGIRLNNPTLCTVKLARRILPSLPSRSLDEVTRFLEVRIPERHRASGDTFATALVLVKFLSYLQQRGIRTLEDLLRFQHEPAETDVQATS
ncbi:MAG TPA: exonuclease domain-containing protein [Bacteroidota bacterium]|nr:exonuclease domain-containing protein [Bacteroidota bacterium]